MNELKSNILKNSLLLVFRLVIITLIGFFSTRLIFLNLGDIGYGFFILITYSITTTIFFSDALNSTFSRYFNINVKKKAGVKIINQYCTSGILISAVFSLFAILLFNVFSKIDFFEMFFYKSTSLTQKSITLLSLFIFISKCKMPLFNLVISNEKFRFYSIITLIEQILKLISIFLAITIKNYDFLISLLFFQLLSELIIFIVYYFYSRFKLNFSFSYSKNKTLEILNFTKICLMGSVSKIILGKFNIILAGIFFGNNITSSLGIKEQLRIKIYALINNFQFSYKPSLMHFSKNANVDSSTFNLFYWILKIAYSITFILIFTIFSNTEFLLKIWLDTENIITVNFIKISFITLLVNSLSSVFWNIIEADGNIKSDQKQLLILSIFFIVIAFLGYYLFNNFYIGLITQIIVSFVMFFSRFESIKIILGKSYFNKTFYNFFMKLIFVIPTISFLALKILKVYIEKDIIILFLSFLTALFMVLVFLIRKKDIKYLVRIVNS